MRGRDKIEADVLGIALPLLARSRMTAKLFPLAAGRLQPVKKKAAKSILAAQFSEPKGNTRATKARMSLP
jgi:hypothetical protein